MNTFEVLRIPILSDNYVYLIHDAKSGATACVDPGVAGPVIQAAQDRGWIISHILITHTHFDHIEGVSEIVEKFGAEVYGNPAECDRIPKYKHAASEGTDIQVGTVTCKVLAVPGHTQHHLAYEFSGALFCGDTLFSLGCGRLLGGTAAQLWHSLQKIRSLPHDTKIYCAHEYTQANAGFAIGVDPDNDDLKQRRVEVDKLRSAGLPTVPAILGNEIKCNPFLRCDNFAFKAQMRMIARDSEDVFAELRRRKDNF